MFDTVIKYNIFNKEDLEFLKENLINEKYIINASAKEDDYSVIHCRNKSLIEDANTRRIMESIDKEICSMLETTYNVKILQTTGNCVAQYTKGKFIGIHKDWQEDDEWVIKNNKSRVHISSVLYINDDYLRWRNLFL